MSWPKFMRFEQVLFILMQLSSKNPRNAQNLGQNLGPFCAKRETKFGYPLREKQTQAYTSPNQHPHLACHGRCEHAAVLCLVFSRNGRCCYSNAVSISLRRSWRNRAMAGRWQSRLLAGPQRKKCTALVDSKFVTEMSLVAL